MKHTSSRALRGAALALALGLISAAGAWAAPQTITIPNGTTVAHAVCGNGNIADNGNAPCDPSFDGNTVTIATGGTVQGDVHGRLDEQTSADTTATGNQVDISGSVTGDSHGAWAHSITSGNATVTGNGLTVNSGAVTSTVIGGLATTDTSNATATATGNSVSVLDGSVNGEMIVGGKAASTDGGDVVATGNTVTISGATLGAGVKVYAGWADSTGTETATNNTLTISGMPVFGAGVSLYGGATADGTSTGNTLNLHTAGLTVVDLAFFQNLSFYLPAGLTVGGNMLTATGTADLGMNAVVTVSLEGAGPALHTGDTFNLIAGGVTGSIAPESASGVLKGYNYKLEIPAGSNNLVLTIDAPVVTGTAAVPTLGETTLAVLGLLLAALAFVTLRRKV